MNFQDTNLCFIQKKCIFDPVKPFLPYIDSTNPMIRQLEQLAANQCDKWLDLTMEAMDEFLEEYAAYVDSNPAEAETYLLSQPVEYMGPTTIAFEGISRFSDHPEVLLPAVKKILGSSYENKDDLDKLDPLYYIETIDFFEDHPSVYMQHMDLLASYLRPEKDPEFLLNLLQIFDMTSVTPDETIDKQYTRKKWFDNITELANYGSLKVKIAAREILRINEQDGDVIPLTFMERIKKLFGITN